jgi:RNA polymerase sigma-70 factor (ECF subfamily)
MSSTLVDDRQDRAFERLYALHVRDVHRYVLTVLRNPAEADDVTQTTFLNAYRAMKAGEEPLHPQNWLISIAHNACHSRIRWSTRRLEVPLDDVASQLAVHEPERPNIRELLRALRRLPANQRNALTMRELEGRSYPEIAETLGVTVGAVEALIARARRTLRLQAAALRGLTVFQLPRSLRKLFETGEAGLGAGAVAKVAAVLVTGAVAGGIGHAIVEARAPAAPKTPSVQLWQHDSAPSARTHRAPVVTAAPVHRSAVPPPTQRTPGIQAATPPAVTAAPVHAGPLPQPPAQPQSQERQVVAAVQRTERDAVQTVPVALPQLPALPPVVTPPVEVPTVLQPPELPPLPLP